ncbi:MAG: deoxyribose-phosphate aldolase [Clostridia bacterium]|nr:deoxyribose-phosphate aldolase [Clostridia bacterium]
MRKYSAEYILSHCDHTDLKQTSVWQDIRALCDEGMRYRTASVCIPACFVKQASDYVCGKLAICTVIGFPNGYSTTQTKVFETAQAVADGADEIDMVINISHIVSGNVKAAVEEINAVKAACGGKLLKVIIETCLLTEEQKVLACKAVAASDADFIKTSTGFSKHGATPGDVSLLVRECTGKSVKAAGGIRSVEDAETYLDLGASRLGTSALVKLLAKEVD